MAENVDVLKKMWKVKLDTAEPEDPEFQKWLKDNGISSNFSMRGMLASEREVEYYGSKENLEKMIDVWWDGDGIFKSFMMEA